MVKFALTPISTREESEMQSIQDTSAFRGTNRYGRAFTQLDIRRQIVVIIDVLGMVHAKRHKTTGFTTKKFLIRNLPQQAQLVSH